ncbi:ankyrin repeat protein [Rutstroemia sp. NJR-2017a BVV2]|nr:ankyrin repeat protein [Rutstroemia sp. NJR-2017a BVV2]
MTNNVINNSDLTKRRHQLNTVTQRGLRRMEEGKTKLPNGIAEAAKFVSWAKDFIGEAVKASPEASMVWAGVCIVIPLLTKPVIADEENRDGFTYVTTRMRYYVALEPLLLQLSRDPASVKSAPADLFADPFDELKKQIVGLYRHILDFQFRSILRFYRKWYKNYGQDLNPFSGEDWAETTKTIITLEETVRRDFEQINSLATRNELGNLNTEAKILSSYMQQLLSVAEEQLGVHKEHLNIAVEQLKIQEQIIEKLSTREEQQCFQLFRLTKDNKDDSYEWYKGRVEDRVEGTCQWFLNHQNFKSWLNEDMGILLTSADPGCGKSVLAKYLIDCVLPQSATVCYFFFKDQDQNTIQQALCALLHQLFSYKPSLIRHAMPEYSKSGTGLMNVTTSLWEILENAGADPEAGPVIFVLDALDECIESDFKGLMRMLKNHLHNPKAKSSKVKFLLTSRPYDSITSEFQDLVKTFPYIRIPGEDKSDDIGREVNCVIKHRVNQLAKKTGLSPEIKSHLEQRLLEIPHRTYLWVYLVFDYLESDGFKKTNRGIDLAISTLPESVNGAYEKILSRSRDRKMVRKALSIVLAATRPLTLAEMNIAVNIDASEKIDLEREEDFQGNLRHWCGLFISVYHGKVYFLHQTAREFLLSKLSTRTATLKETSTHKATPEVPIYWHNSISLREAHSVIAESCIVYLEFINSGMVVLPDKNGMPVASKYMVNDDFLKYSAINWTTHFRGACISDDEPIIHSVLNICNADLKSASVWFKMFWENTEYESCPTFTTILIAAYSGLEGIVKLLLEKGADIESKEDGEGWTALLVASKNGYETIVKLLLEKGADIESKDKWSRTALLIASENSHETIVKLLLEKGADIESKDKWSRTALLIASENGYETIVKLLLEKGADIESKDYDEGRTALSIASKNGDETIVKLLLEKGADIESKDNKGRTALLIASKNGDETIVKLLLEKGADIESKDNRGQTALSLASQNGYEIIVKLLLEKGADIESKEDGEGWTALLIASQNGDETIVKLLLEKGADIESKEDGEGWTALLIASQNGDETIVKLLLEKGADIESKDNKGRTALLIASENGDETIVKLLLEKGADIESKDNECCTALWYASRNRNQDTCEILLEKGAKPLSIEERKDLGLS